MDKLFTSRMPLLRSLTDEASGELLRSTDPMTVHRGGVIFTTGDVADGVYFLVKGKVKLSRSFDSTEPGRPAVRESLLRLLGPGSMFGELSALDGGHRSSTATAVVETTLAHLPMERLQALMVRRPEIATGFLKQLASRLRWADLVLSGLAVNDVGGRIAATLLYLADALGEPGNGGIVVRHDLTQSELASMVGATRETVNRTLTDLATRGIIDNGIRRLTILDTERLRQRIN